MPSKKSIVFPVPCAYCGRQLHGLAEHTYDHVVPRVLGGTSSPSNLVHACPKCNSEKAARTLEDFLLANPHLRRPTLAKATTPAVMRRPKVRDFEPIGLPGAVAGDDVNGYTYTPPRGSGISKKLRAVLRSKGIAIVWAPLEPVRLLPQ